MSEGSASTSTSHGDLDSSRSVKLVVAVDFGTTYSGYAFSIGSHRTIYMMKKPTGGAGDQKIPTCLLLEPDLKFHSFGKGAQYHYYNELEEAEQHEWLYFDRFKMSLHSSKSLNRDKTLKAACGREILALTVFARSLEFFKDNALEDINAASATDFRLHEVTWVVTVPAIWEEPSKQFMREAAYMAGMADSAKPDQLIIALEPEAASLYCHQMEMLERNLSGAAVLGQLKPETRYIVADCGGGTVDCTIHEITERKYIKALQPPSGGPWGGTEVDKNFENLLANIFGYEYLQQFKLREPAEWVDLISVNFENSKRDFSQGGSPPAIRIDALIRFLRDEGQQADQMVRDFANQNVTLRRGALRLTREEVTALFTPVVNKIRDHIVSMVQRINGLKYVVMVGGFSESSYLAPVIKETIEERIEERSRVIIPHDARLAVVKGAVLFGQNPNAICERRAANTVGIGTTQPFIEGYHRPAFRISGLTAEEDLCDNVFETFVQANDAVGVGKSVQKSFSPSYERQMDALVDIYFSPNRDVAYTTEEGVSHKGEMLVPLNGCGLDREVKISMYFGESEFKVTASDETGRRKQVTVNFLGRYN